MSNGDDYVIVRMRAMADRVPVAIPPSAPIRRRARVRRRGRLAASGLAALLVGVAIFLPLHSLLGLGSASNVTTGTGVWTETYFLSDFRVEYPVTPHPFSMSPTVSTAGVTFHSVWSGAVFPGEAPCEIRLFDGGDNVVGSIQFSYATYGPSSPDHRDPFSVPVDHGVPVRAEGSCGPGTPPGTGGYRFAGLHMKLGDNGARLVGDVSWVTDDSPLDQYCVASFQMPDGSSDEESFTLSITAGKDMTILLLPNNFADASPLGIECEPFTGQNDNDAT
jgi:hypothetical protein